MNLATTARSARITNHSVSQLIFMLKLLGVAASYALLAKLALTFFSTNGVVSIIWPSSGLALAVLLIGGKRYYPGVFLGALIANAMTGLALGVAAAIAIGNTLEALLGAWLLTRDGRFDASLRALSDYLRLIVLAGFVSCSVAALNGSTTLLVSGFINGSAYFQNLLHWWMGDALGVIMIAPLLLVWRRIPDGWLEPKRLIEAISLLFLTFLTGQIIFLDLFRGTSTLTELLSKGYWMFLLITLVAVRLGTSGVLLALIITAIQTLLSAVLGKGFFADDIARTGLVNCWFYIVTLSVVGMALAAHITEREQLEQHRSRRLRHLDAMDRITQISLNSTRIEDLLSGVLDEMLTLFNADRAWFLYPCDPDAPSWSVPMERTRPEWPGAFGMTMPMTPAVADVFREMLACSEPLPYGPTSSRGIPAALAEQFSIQSQLQMALYPRVDSPWVIGLHHCAQPHPYDENDLLIFKDIGRRVADALSSMITLNNLRESEKKFRTLFEQMVSGFALHRLVYDAQGKPVDYITLDVNPEFERLLNTSREQIIGKKAYETIPGLDKKWLDIFNRVALTRTPYSYEEYASNLDRWFAGTVFCPEKGIIAETFIDITERKQSEQELKRSNAELEQFSYAVSHDMRQPLRMISSYLQLLEISLSDRLDGEKRDYFNFAIEGAKRIDQMLIALLEYSRTGRLGEPPSWIDSHSVLDAALQFLQPAIGEAGAKLHITGIWPRILASHDEILRLLQNLIGNAAKYRVARRIPEIFISSETVGNEWRFCVADNGVGIVPDQIKQLFQVFRRLHAREAYEGTGIGLALCRKIAEHHKGRIWAESAGVGLGSQFCVALPVLRERVMSLTRGST